MSRIVDLRFREPNAHLTPSLVRITSMMGVWGKGEATLKRRIGTLYTVAGQDSTCGKIETFDRTVTYRSRPRVRAEACPKEATALPLSAI